MNLWTFSGRLGRDAEIINTRNGDMLKMAVAVIRVAPRLL